MNVVTVWQRRFQSYAPWYEAEEPKKVPEREVTRGVWMSDADWGEVKSALVRCGQADLLGEETGA